jgi:hypothetical protein
MIHHAEAAKATAKRISTSVVLSKRVMEAQRGVECHRLGPAGAMAAAHLLREEQRLVHKAWGAHVPGEGRGAVAGHSGVPREGVHGCVDVGSAAFHGWTGV